jgi:hypothetical protein
VKAANIQAVCNFYSCTQAIIIVEGHAAHKSLLFLQARRFLQSQRKTIKTH